MKKSQVKFGETFAILIIVYLVLVSGFIWYNNINQKRIYELSAADNRNKGFEKYNFIINLDMLHSSEHAIVDDNFDSNSVYAFAAFAQTPEGKKYIEDRIGDANITITIYNHTEIRQMNSPTFIERNPVQLYLNMPTRTEIKNLEVFSIIIPVVNETGKRTDVGILRIEVPSS